MVGVVVAVTVLVVTAEGGDRSPADTRNKNLLRFFLATADFVPGDHDSND